MIRRRILCEGPEDVAALRALAVGHFGWSSGEGRSPSLRSLSVGEDRGYDLTQLDKLTVELRAISGAKSQLATAVGDIIDNDFGGNLTCLGVLFDPDAEHESVQFDALAQAIGAKAKSWQVTREATAAHLAQWSFARSPDPVVALHAIPWRSAGPIVDKLDDAQHLERLECQILSNAFPALAPLVEQWVDLMRDVHGLKPSWKSAIHLWCALVDPKQSTASFAERVLHQHETCRSSAKDALDATSLLGDLTPLLGRV